ncbi:MAG: hypothetical protein JJE30_10125 [Desulfuromonadales bacterium]|nr:hypothetical protein [Desulfuromonadales bacterium]
MRKSIVFTIVTGVNILLLALLAVHAHFSRISAASERLERAELVRTLQLTDLCLFTEARYTRHPAMSDRFAPFQDHPGAMEHFPSGSLVTPPIKRIHEHSP